MDFRMQTSKELVLRTLEFRNPARAPRNLWTLPWAEQNYHQELKKIQADFPGDIINCPSFLQEKSPVTGDPYEVGEYVDEWGCRFKNLHRGVIGEVKEPLVADEEWEDADQVRIPREALKVDLDAVARFREQNQDKFVLSGCCPRPFERLQFIRGTEALYVDLMLRPERMVEFIKKMHDFYCEELEVWAKTGVDGLTFMDDWGAQKSLLINPQLWRELFKPLYRDYIQIAHSHGKKAFMHSDGYILEILPDLIELGLDAVNSQLFCMGLDRLEQFKGKITFWGEMDRQHLLPQGTPEQIRAAVLSVKESLYQNGGCIAQCEFGPGAKPENVYAVFQGWDDPACKKGEAE